MRVAVIGATGFVGRRLMPALVDAGHEAIALARTPADYRGPGRAVRADVADAALLRRALHEVRPDVVIYLVHSLGHNDFAERDAEAARHVAVATKGAGVRRIVYLGGLGDDRDALSAHLRSRREVEHLLAATGVPVTVLRAGIILGDGGASFELLRQLVMHLPVMTTPRWVNTRCQPVAIDDVVGYLVGVLEAPATQGRTFDLGGPEIMRYMDMLLRMAAILRRPLLVLPVPILTPRLSSRWLALVTDVDLQTARNLVDSMSNEVVVLDGDAIRSVLPRDLIGFDQAVREALADRCAARATTAR